MPVPVSPATNITPSSDEWVSIDLGNHLDEGDHDPKIGFFEIRNPTDNWGRRAGLRPPGSNWDTRAKTWDHMSHFRYTPVRQRRVEAYASGNVEIWYHGYVDRRRGGSYQQARRLPRDSYGQWFTINARRHVNTDRTPRMIFLRWVRRDDWGFRRIGCKHPRQTEKMVGRTYEMIHGSVGFCDPDGRVQLYIQDRDVYPFITGWVDDRANVNYETGLSEPSMADEWHTVNATDFANQHNDIVWLFTGNRHWYAGEDDTVRVDQRKPGSGDENYDHAGMVQWRPVQLSNYRFEQRISRVGDEHVSGGSTRLIGRTSPMVIERDDDDDDDDDDEPPPEDPDEQMGPIGYVRANYDDRKVDLPLFHPDHVDASCIRVGLPDGQVGAFALAPRTVAEWPRFTVQTESGRYGIDTIDVDWREPAPHRPIVTTSGHRLLDE